MQLEQQNAIQSWHDGSTATMMTDTRYGKCEFWRADKMIGASLHMYGEYQQTEINWLTSIMHPNSVVYDIGANIGYHAMGFASRTNFVHSFEASPQHLKILQHNVGRNPKVTIHHCAVSNQSGTASILEFDPMVSDNFGCTAIGNTGTDVPTQRIDDMLLPYPHVMKIDVEGHECAVMQGAEQTIKQSQPLIFFEAMGSIADSYTFLQSLDVGYNLYWWATPNYNVNNFKQQSKNIFGNSGIYSVIAHTTELPAQFVPVKDEHDTWQKVVERN